MNEYRITLPNSYPVGSLGATDVRERQGYYVSAESPKGAVIALAARKGCRNLVADVQADKFDATKIVRVEV